MTQTVPVLATFASSKPGDVCHVLNWCGRQHAAEEDAEELRRVPESLWRGFDEEVEVFLKACVVQTWLNKCYTEKATEARHRKRAQKTK